MKLKTQEEKEGGIRERKEEEGSREEGEGKREGNCRNMYKI